jgi:hypothetical protein
MTNSLGDLPNFVADAYRIHPETAFKPENIVIGSYTFLPWVRGGVGAVVTSANGALRASIDVAVPVQAPAREVTANVTGIQVRGPGDVLGLDERQIIRRYPEPGTPNAEDSFLAHIEFDRPVLPWLFSPVAADGDRLVPWIALVVLAQGRYTLRPGAGGRPDQVETYLGELQQVDDAWAWAHVQLVGPSDSTPSVDDRLTPSYGPANLSRLLCPRHLDPDQQYLACVVPLYNAGAARGLGTAAPGTLDTAWKRKPDGSDIDTPVQLPVYSSWRFATGPAGDFGSLAHKLHGVPAPWQVGRRITQMSTPGGGLPPLGPADTGRLQTVKAAVYSPNLPQAGSQDPTEVAAVTAETAQWPPPETEALRTELNRPSILAATTASPGDPVPRPIVGPEIYDRYQAAVSRVDPDRDGDWFGQMNLNPPNRVAAGLGARVVQKDQEQLMQSAWAQVGEVDAANRALRWAQLARFVGSSSYTRHISPLSFGDLLATTRRLQSRVLTQPGVTVAADVGSSNLADSAVSSAFRRVSRPLGGLARFIAADPGAQGKLVADGDTPRDMQRPYQELDGVNTVSAGVAGALDAQRVAPALGGDPTAIGAALDAAGQALAAQPAAIDAFTGQVATAAPNPADFAVFVGKQLLSQLDRAAATNKGKLPVWALSAAGLARSVQVIPELAAEAQVVARAILAGIKMEPPPPSQALTTILGRAREATADAIGAGFGQIGADLVAPSWPGTPLRPAVMTTAPALLALVDPAVNLTTRMRARIGAPSWLPANWFDDRLLNPVMAAPVFTRPMYEALDAYSRDWLLPGLNSFPQPDIVTVLNSNPRFVEAFLGGLSHEMGRELLWRGYPTDQRGTYFRRFWNRAKDDLMADFASFAPTDLGGHLDSTLNGIVLMVRGELIRRYPNAMVLAMRAGSVDSSGVPTFEDPVMAPDTLATISFHGHLPPDIALVGFQLTLEDINAGTADGRGWWFLIAEHPTAPRFGLADGPNQMPATTRDQLAWSQVDLRFGRFLDGLRPVSLPDTTGGPTTTFGAEAASNAHVLLRDPVRAAFYGKTMLKGTGTI